MRKQMNVFGCTKKLTNLDPPKRPLEDKLKNLEELIQMNNDKVKLTIVTVFTLNVTS